MVRFRGDKHGGGGFGPRLVVALWMSNAARPDSRASGDGRNGGSAAGRLQCQQPDPRPARPVVFRIGFGEDLLGQDGVEGRTAIPPGHQR